MALPSKFSLTGKTAFISGASRGIGKAIAQDFAEAGCNVIVSARNTINLENVRTEFKTLGYNIHIEQLDLECIDTLEESLNVISSRHPEIDILVNNVGGRRTSEPLEAQTLLSWRASLDRNLTNAFICMKHFGRKILNSGKGGRIINMASMSAFVSNKDVGNRGYETSKAALVQLTKAAAADWAPHGITVNAICPGLIMTDTNKKWLNTNSKAIESLIASTPMGRAGTPEEIASLALFLASPAASFITGGVYVADGGYTLW